MGVATLLVFNRGEVPDSLLEWKSLTRAIEQLHSLSLELEITPLKRFYNSSRGEAIRIMSEEEVLEMEEEMGAKLQGDSYYLPNGDLLYSMKDQWFEPTDGLKTLQTLLVYVEHNPNYWDQNDAKTLDSEEIIEILRELKGVLERGQKRGCLFHLQPLC